MCCVYCTSEASPAQQFGHTIYTCKFKSLYFISWEIDWFLINTVIFDQIFKLASFIAWLQTIILSVYCLQKHWTFHCLKRYKQNSTFQAKALHREVRIYTVTKFPTKGLRSKHGILPTPFQAVKCPMFLRDFDCTTYTGNVSSRYCMLIASSKPYNSIYGSKLTWYGCYLSTLLPNTSDYFPKVNRDALRDHRRHWSCYTGIKEILRRRPRNFRLPQWVWIKRQSRGQSNSQTVDWHPIVLSTFRINPWFPEIGYVRA